MSRIRADRIVDRAATGAPLSGGFSVPSSGNADVHNGNGGTNSYLFLAIA